MLYKVLLVTIFTEDILKNLSDQPEECECLVYEHCELKDTNKDFLTLQTLSQYGVSPCMVFHLISEGSANDVMGLVNAVGVRVA
ncbi:hypothetical protein [Candidatus Ichthyocystis sparus]|uniref:hypothetical protein n=2 Tax=Candidatus Ichthyocystis sparus TaxID=1561004 RepID=UPI0011476AB2|nr:hypothetical protein [Candidatus Ichthyocystis sparus]